VALHRFKRATINWSLGRVGSALEDFDAVLKINPDFDQAYSSRGAIHLKQGRFQAAETDYSKVLQKNPGDSTAKSKVCSFFFLLCLFLAFSKCNSFFSFLFFSFLLFLLSPSSSKKFKSLFPLSRRQSRKWQVGTVRGPLTP
jgi:tetratricopeptide (TPR) repeat protein